MAIGRVNEKLHCKQTIDILYEHICREEETRDDLQTDRSSNGRLCVGTDPIADVETKEKKRNNDEKVTPINCCFIVVMMVIVIGVLMLGFYFRYVMGMYSNVSYVSIDHLVYVFNVLVVILGTFSVYHCVAALFGPVPCGRCRV